MGSIKGLFEREISGVYVKSLRIGSNIIEVILRQYQNILYVSRGQLLQPTEHGFNEKIVPA